LGEDTLQWLIECDLYHAPEALPEPAAFDLVYVTWGAINWLPDISRWPDKAWLPLSFSLKATRVLAASLL
jgi:hypothetical protein